MTTFVARRRHGFLILASLFLGISLALPRVGWSADAEVGIIAADDAYARSQAGELIVIDVRSSYEWRQTGIPAGAQLATVHNRQGIAGFLKEVIAIAADDRNKPIALICARGWRSAAAANYLRQKGFTHVYDVSEGMLGRDEHPGWLKRELPVEPCDNC